MNALVSKFALAPMTDAVMNAEFVIFCVGQEPERIEEFQRRCRYLGISIKELLGSYKGQQERSFIASIQDWAFIRSWVLDEESVLLLGARDKLNRRKATLHYVSTEEEVDLGRFESTTEADALSREAWTYDPQQCTYFVCN